MFGLDLGQVVKAADPYLQQALHALKCIYQEVKRGSDAQERGSRVLETEFGVIAPELSARLQPRQLSKLPTILEGRAAADKELDLEAMAQGRAPSRGFYANLGDNAFKVILVGVSGEASAEHTLPPGTTIAVSSYISKLIVRPQDGNEAFYQVYVQ